MKPILTSFLILVTSLVAQARLHRLWSDQELLDQSDLVVIATPTNSADTQEHTDLPGISAHHVIGVETRFAVSAVVKGDKELKNFVLHHYRDDKAIDNRVVYAGPNLVSFKPEEKRKFLLFVKREADGRYAPTVGQVDPGFQGIAALGDPMSAPPCSPPLVDVVKATSPNEEKSGLQQDVEHAKWVERCLKDLESIHVGMTRTEIDSKLCKDGGLQGIFSVRYTHPECPLFKIDVEFESKLNPADQNRAVEGKEDKALKVSSPRIERPFGD